MRQTDHETQGGPGVRGRPAAWGDGIADARLPRARLQLKGEPMTQRNSPT